MKLYNTLTRKKQEFRPLKAGQVTFYSCGPTVYNYAHIGNFRAYMASDLLKRYLLYKGFKVRHVMNITDVDDKTIRDSQKQGMSLKEFTERYTGAFFEDLEKLSILPADHYPRATGSIDGMVRLIKVLLDKGHAYKAEDGIYFKIASFKGYGRLSRIDLAARKAGARIKSDEYDKESAHDFALWKFWTPADGEVFWDSELGKGRPGWHIECSVMSSTSLGDTFDIHSGGVDLIFPHHENEIAQSEAATGRPFARYWFHNEYILVDGKKMSKSLGNFYTLRDILAKGYKPRAVRYLLLATHYRQQLNFTFDGLEAAGAAVDRLLEFRRRLQATGKAGTGELAEKARKGFAACMDDDLNISGALAEIFNFVKEINKLELSAASVKEAEELMNEFDSVLGVMDEQLEIPAELRELAKQRQAARDAKDFAAADALRQEIRKKGFAVDDTPEGPRLKPL